ncbi:type II toxin-antitoxin system HicB family antitoxin [Aerosakkonemataceae cyanobacterium BLCC-F154]|uniref:Type II toxin-antitoxin system HicB family antitoxin n=1 Tax=Floridaenema fluviatile BLCC-F154 TaxID=3153640 RepID=A0ABV4YBA4_9CYAN
MPTLPNPLFWRHKKSLPFRTLAKHPAMSNTFTAIFEKVDDWYIGYVEELSGANVQEKTLEEARESLQEAIELILISNRELAERELSGRDVIREQIKVNI